MNRDVVRSKFRGALLGAAIGDALGAPFEGMSVVSADAVDRVAEQLGGVRYTDDTHMTIGMAQSLIACRGFDGAHMARSFAANFSAEPWRGYGSGPPRVFALLQRGVPWDQAARALFGGAGSFGNGAAMRVAPAALLAYQDLTQVRNLAEQTAIITHTHERGVEGAVLQACAIAILVQQSPGGALDTATFLQTLRACTRVPQYAEQLARVIALLTTDRGTAAREIGNGVAAVEAVPAALFSFLRTPDSFADVMHTAIGMAGDTDTIASMAGALSGAYLGEDGIPVDWRRQVEGADLLRDLADELTSLALECRPFSTADPEPHP